VNAVAAPSYTPARHSAAGTIKNLSVLGIPCVQSKWESAKGQGRVGWLVVFTDSLIFCGAFSFHAFSNMKNNSSK